MSNTIYDKVHTNMRKKLQEVIFLKIAKSVTLDLDDT